MFWMAVLFCLAEIGTGITSYLLSYTLSEKFGIDISAIQIFVLVLCVSIVGAGILTIISERKHKKPTDTEKQVIDGD